MNKEEKKFLLKSMKHISKFGLVVEIGSWMGGSSVKLAEGIIKYKNGARLYCVDPFKEFCDDLEVVRKGRDIRKIFDKNMKGYLHHVVEMYSVDASDEFEDESIDFIFIDGDHTYEGVKSDIEAWYPRIVTGGVMCGHDFGAKYPGVGKAVKEIFKEFSLPARSIWKVVK